MVSHRSTKGASKARRDHINHEIRNMRALLPIGPDEQERMSYLHSMSAICTYIRKSVLLQGLPAGDGSPCSLPYEAFLQALHGFILVTSAQGKMVYLSENVVDYLGVSMIDLLQSDTLFDLVEPSDVPVVQSNLDVHNNPSTDRSFLCSMQTSKACKHRGGSCSVLVRGGFLSVPDLELLSSSSAPVRPPLFVALCRPTLNRLGSSDLSFCHSFCSVHGLDMTFAELSDRVVFHLGYSAEELSGASWYGLVHPGDLSPCAESHRRLVETEEDVQVEMVLRLQCRDLSWVWVYTRADRKSKCQSISCTNCIISDTEARFLQTRIGSAAFGPSSPPSTCHAAALRTPAAPSSSSCSSKSKCFKRRRASDSQSEEEEPPAGSRARRDSPAPQGDNASPSLFTPPLSPASSPSLSSSSSSPLQQEQELSCDLLLMNVHAFTAQLPSPEASPSYYSNPEAALTCHPPPSLAAASEHVFQPAAFAALRVPSPLPSPYAYDFHHPCPPDVCESSLELHRDDFGLLEQPAGGSLVQHVPPHQHHHHVLHPSFTPDHSPTSAQSLQYDEMEQAEISILAQQISSLARSFDMYQTQAARGLLPSDSDWPQHPSPPCDLFLDEGIIDSILKDLDARKQEHAAVPNDHQERSVCSTAGSQTREGSAFGSVDPFSMGRHGQNSGLHQLNSFTVCRVESLHS